MAEDPIPFESSSPGCDEKCVSRESSHVVDVPKESSHVGVAKTAVISHIGVGKTAVISHVGVGKTAVISHIGVGNSGISKSIEIIDELIFKAQGFNASSDVMKEYDTWAPPKQVVFNKYLTDIFTDYTVKSKLNAFGSEALEYLQFFDKHFDETAEVSDIEREFCFSCVFAM